MVGAKPVKTMEKGSDGAGLLHGRYELGRLLGHGTFAKVYHARNVTTGKSMAMKVVAKEKVIKVGMVEQIKREISVMSMVKHPNIVELHEVMASKSKIYFAMELVRGGELFAKISKGRLREDVARVYFQQLISAVDFCHSRGVYHRDLKPENLLLDEEGNLKVTDFGLSALTEHLKQDGLFHTTCGTPAYVAPEVILKKGYDGAKADLWSCGVILFVLLAGYLPFQDDNLVNMYRKIYRGESKNTKRSIYKKKKMLDKLIGGYGYGHQGYGHKNHRSSGYTFEEHKEFMSYEESQGGYFDRQTRYDHHMRLPANHNRPPMAHMPVFDEEDSDSEVEKFYKSSQSHHKTVLPHHGNNHHQQPPHMNFMPPPPMAQPHHNGKMGNGWQGMHEDAYYGGHGMQQLGRYGMKQHGAQEMKHHDRLMAPQIPPHPVYMNPSHGSGSEHAVMFKASENWRVSNNSSGHHKARWGNKGF